MKALYKGRIGRLYFFSLVAGIYIGLQVVTILFGVMPGGNEINGYYEQPEVVARPYVVLVILIAFFFALSIPVVKRFHDLDKGGEYFFTLFIPLANLYFGVQLLFSKGIDGPNKYGEDPLVPVNAGVIDMEVTCKNCNNELELDNDELLNRKFICPICSTENVF